MKQPRSLKQMMTPEQEGEAPTEMAEESSDSTEIPLSIIPDAKEGEEVRVKVVSINSENGTATVTKCPPKPPMKGSEGLAAEYEQPMEE